MSDTGQAGEGPHVLFGHIARADKGDFQFGRQILSPQAHMNLRSSGRPAPSATVLPPFSPERFAATSAASA